MYNLGVMYANDQSIKPDLDQVEHWLKLAADQGFAELKWRRVWDAGAEANSVVSCGGAQVQCCSNDGCHGRPWWAKRRTV